MIRLERTFTPMCLAPARTQALVEEYKASGKAVWNFFELKEALLRTSRDKCAYCECRLSRECKYVEVEHYLDKNRNPDKVVTWDNLLPSCKRCNGEKGTHDSSAEPLVNPYQVDPRLHLGFRLYRLRPLTPLGDSTIEALNLNDPDRLVKVRFEVGEALHMAIHSASAILESVRQKESRRTRNRLINQVRTLLLECQHDAAYSATYASVIHGDAEYLRLRDDMNDLGLWSDEFEALHQSSLSLALSTI